MPEAGANYGSLLREWRRARGLSQEALGLEASVSSRHVSFLETGRSQPSREMVLRLAEALDMPCVAVTVAPEPPGRATQVGRLFDGRGIQTA